MSHPTTPKHGSSHPMLNLFEPPLAEGQARDPVCAMAVEMDGAEHTAEHNGKTYYFCCDGCRSMFVASPEKFVKDAAPAAPAVADLAVDPVCGMKVDPATAKHRTEHAGKSYFFCSARCREKFAADPAPYLAPPPAPQTPSFSSAIYTCPMHPEVRQQGPGSCPICGMALEPEIAALEQGKNPELADMTKRFWIALALSLPVVVIEMGGHVFGLRGVLGAAVSNWVQLALATPVALWAGAPSSPARKLR